MLALTMAYVFYAFGMIFLVCELCQRASDEFEKIGDIIGEFHWYLFPDELTHLLPTIIAVAQQPVGIDCFGSMKCTRDSFKRVSFITDRPIFYKYLITISHLILQVVNGGFSYFMVLRQFLQWNKRCVFRVFFYSK